MAFVKGPFVVGEDGHRSDGVVVGHQRDAAEASFVAHRLNAEFFHLGHEIVADQNRLPRADDVFGEVIPSRPRALGHTRAVDHFQIETHFVAQRIEFGNVEILHVEQAAEFFPHFAHQVFFVERRAQRAPDFVEHVEFFGAPRSLLDQVAVLDGHADLMSQR